MSRTRYYFNENPQVTMWRENCERIFVRSMEHIFSDRESDEGLKKLKSKIEHFNSLPWYKKMFFKFKI